MIFTSRTIKVVKDKSIINEPIVLYRGDFDVELRFTITDMSYKFKNGSNFLDTEKASFAQLILLAPDGSNVFTEVGKCEDGAAVFILHEEVIDEIAEVGKYSFQIRLFDNFQQSRITLPPVEFGIEVREPVASEDHTDLTDVAMVGYSIAKVEQIDEPVPGIFDADDNYIKTEWETGDRISEAKLNKIEQALETIRNYEVMINKQSTSSFNVLQTQINVIFDVLAELTAVPPGITVTRPNVNGDRIELTTNKYQGIQISSDSTIVLPDVNSIHEIHLFVDVVGSPTITLPNAKKQDDVQFTANSTYELIFTYTTEWLFGCIEYK